MDIEQAVQNAKAFALKSLGLERTTNVRLEEIESSAIDGTSVWLITLSSEKPFPAGSIVNAFRAIGADVDREYKVFAVAKETGEVLSMKIRLLTTAGQ